MPQFCRDCAGDTEFAGYVDHTAGLGKVKIYKCLECAALTWVPAEPKRMVAGVPAPPKVRPSAQIVIKTKQLPDGAEG